MIASRRCTIPARAVEPDALAVGPARGERRVHALQRRPVGRRVTPQLDAEAAHVSAAPPRRSRAASTSAPNSRACGRSTSSSVSACHCTPSTKRPSSASIPSTVPSGAHATARRPSPSRSTAWWWKEFTRSASAPTARASSEPGSTATSCVTVQPGCGLAVVGQVLEERAAARDVERLGAAADAEDRQAGGVGVARDRQLEGVQVGLDRAELGVRLGAVGGGVDVRAARQADAGERRAAAPGTSSSGSGGSTTGIAPERASART